MFAVNDFNILTPVWKLPSELYAQNSGTWSEIKELYTQDGGTWKKVWNRNYFGSTGQQHPYWQYGFNYNFQKTNDTISWGTYFSTNNAGFYYYPSVGILRLEIGAVDGGGYGDCYLDPASPLRVDPGQTYTHSVYIEGKTSNVNMSLRAYSNSTKAEAYKGGSGKSSFETTLQQVAAGNTVSLSITIPTGHYWIKPYLFIQTNSALPRYYRFSNWSFLRTS